ncbi:kinase-associated lipoprotein B [Paenibacillus oenotherae]|uniref:Kinase-associated lipoprotein B n=1 Tax=Paenibacillus oenotherae TaxID=1435645 RepID=A0ABS7D9T5_9BACL|nr:kinase-associated lipoprotein B [Paenibacillus oenotherae]MBW7476707.1 kinase-associated lipoprotein B [Paenibacillus oenotherae]
MQRDEKFVPEAGAIVVIGVKSGEYIGEVVEAGIPRSLVKVLAVLKHPEQGDLHNPYNPDVPMFHERRALSYTEKTNVLRDDMRPYYGNVPEYKESLQRAVAAELESLDRLKRWAERGLQQLEGLAQEYGK